MCMCGEGGDGERNGTVSPKTARSEEYGRVKQADYSPMAMQTA